jgi:CRP-like cAMP-binding protein
LVYQRDADPADPELSSKVLFTKVLPKGAGFGEIALMYNDKRTASIKAEEQCKTYVLDGGTFKAIIIKASIDKRIVQSGFMEKITLFDSLDKK